VRTAQQLEDALVRILRDEVVSANASFDDLWKSILCVIQSLCASGARLSRRSSWCRRDKMEPTKRDVTNKPVYAIKSNQWNWYSPKNLQPLPPDHAAVKIPVFRTQNHIDEAERRRRGSSAM
jgi:hypothetical protein